jgi:hypothetical protein
MRALDLQPCPDTNRGSILSVVLLGPATTRSTNDVASSLAGTRPDNEMGSHSGSPANLGADWRIS